MTRKVVLVFGQTGSGKTTLVRRLLSGHDRVVVFDTLEEYSGYVVRTFEEFCDFFESCPERFFVVCRFETWAEFDFAARLIWQALENCLLVLEECERFLTSFDSDNPINDIISFGRHKQLSIIGVGRRPSDIAINLRAQVNTIVSFVQSEPRDVAFLENWGFDSNELQALPKFQYLTVGEPIEIQNSQAESSYLPGSI